MKEPFTMFNMSTKKIFDDMFLYLSEVNKKHIKAQKTGGIDEMNGLPVDSYGELTSRFWNLIYKEPYNKGDDQKYEEPDIFEIDNEIQRKL